MKSYEFTGYVERVDAKTQYDVKFILCDVKDKTATDVKFPQSIQFKASTRNEKMVATVEGLTVGDKVSVTFYPWCKTGVSKKSGQPYTINENNASEVKVLEKATSGDAEEEPAGDGNLPF